MEGSLIAKFEELQKRCRRYYFKRRILPLLLIVLILAAGGWYALREFGAKPPVSAVSEANTTITAASQSKNVNAPKKEPSKEYPKKERAKKCVALQLLYSFDTMMEKIFEKKYAAMKLGLDCRIQYGKMLEDGRKQVFLICNTSSKKSALKPYIKALKRAGMDYTIINDDCRYKKRRKHKAKPKKTDNVNNENIEALPDATIVTDISKEQRVRNIGAAGLVEAEAVDMAELEKLYAQRHSYDLALKIARLAYQKGAYKKALTWAKRANKLDRTKEGAWILYAQSLYALGKKRQAKQLLRVYLDYRDSAKAKKLLSEWQ